MADQDIGIFQDRGRQDVGVRGGGLHVDAELRLAAADMGDDLPLGVVDDANADVRALAGEAPERARKDVGRDGDQARDRHRAGIAGSQVDQVSERAVDLVEHALGDRQELSSDDGRRQGPRASLDQPDADPLLQFLQALGQCRLAEMQRPGRRLEAAVLHDRDEDADLLERVIHIILKTQTTGSIFQFYQSMIR